MAKRAYSSFFLFSILSILTCSAGAQVGFSFYSRRIGASSSPFRVISSPKKNNIHLCQIWILVADHKFLESLQDSEIPEYQHANLPLGQSPTQSEVFITSWLTPEFQSFLQCIYTTNPAVRSRSNLITEHLHLLIPTLISIRPSIKSFNQNQTVRVAVAFPLSALENLYRKHMGEFHRRVESPQKHISLRPGAKSAETASPYSDVLMVLNVKIAVVPSKVQVAEIIRKMVRWIKVQSQNIEQVSLLFKEVPPVKYSVHPMLIEKKKKILPLSQRKLLGTVNGLFSATKISQHDSIDPPTTIFPTTPVTNPVTTPATIPYTNPTPTSVTMPSTNPVIMTPTNPATTPVMLPPIINPVNPPFAVPTTTPITNPVTTFPFPPPGTDPVNTPGFDPVNPPITVPTTTPITNPATTFPFPPPGANTVNNPITTPITNPTQSPVTSDPPPSLVQTWCVARADALESALQAALDYACGIGGTDCSGIQETGNCYIPNTLQNHASYAFNMYYQKNPVLPNCDFGGTAVLVNNNPSTESCIYQASSSTSTAISSSSSSSVLNTSSNPAADTPTTFGFEVPPGSRTSVSISANLKPMLPSIILAAFLVTEKLISHL